jgi:hypothetical protein
VDRKGPWYIARAFYEARFLCHLHCGRNLTFNFPRVRWVGLPIRQVITVMVSLIPLTELGKASRHSRLGASIFYHAKEHDVSDCLPTILLLLNYDPRLTPTRCLSRLIYPPAGYTSPSTGPFPCHALNLAVLRKMISLSTCIVSQSGCSDFKLVVLIDDSSSVSLHTLVFGPSKTSRPRWKESCGAKPATR